MKMTTLAAPKKRMRLSLSPDHLRMARFVLWAAFLVALGLAHIHLRVRTRDMEIQRARLQAEWDQIHNRCSALRSEVARLRDGGNTLQYALTELGLVRGDVQATWEIPQSIVDGYDRVYSETALARQGGREFADREGIIVRLIGWIPWLHRDALADETESKP